MMKNKLLLVVLAYPLLYWVLSPFVPGFYYSAAGSLMALIGSLLLATQFVPDAIDVVWRGKRNPQAPPGGDGSHLGVLGVAGFAIGLAWSGIFTLAWLKAGQPQAWVATATSSFGRHIIWPSLFVMLAAPHIGQSTVPRPRTVWIILIVAASIAAAFYVGVQIGQAEKIAAFEFSSRRADLATIASN